MTMWIAISVAGGLALLAGLLAVVRRYSRGEITPPEMILLSVTTCAAVIGAVVGLLREGGSNGYPEIAVSLLIAVALWVEARRRRRMTAGPRERRD